MAGKLKMYKEKIEGYKKFYGIVSTIKKVALSKYRFMQARVKTRDYTQRYTKKVFDIGDDLEEDEAIKSLNKLMYVCIGTNRGNCGPTNSNQYKYLGAVAEAAEKKATFFVIGKKPGGAIAKLYPEQFTGLTLLNDDKHMKHFGWTTFVLEHLDHVATDYDRLQILFHRFVSAGSQKQTRYNIPSWDGWLGQINEIANSAEPAADSGKLNNYRLANAILDKEESEVKDFYDFHRAIAFLNAHSENELSEAAARIVAVEGQLTNIQELLVKTTLLYNKTRQAAITSALIEILSAMTAMADSQKGSGVQKNRFWEASQA
jgi:F-type H+-transporting ATPase subunit gamma